MSFTLFVLFSIGPALTRRRPARLPVIPMARPFSQKERSEWDDQGSLWDRVRSHECLRFLASYPGWRFRPSRNAESMMAEGREPENEDGMWLRGLKKGSRQYSSPNSRNSQIEASTRIGTRRRAGIRIWRYWLG
jgi:hypothetical protein